MEIRSSLLIYDCSMCILKDRFGIFSKERFIGILFDYTYIIRHCIQLCVHLILQEKNLTQK